MFVIIDILHEFVSNNEHFLILKLETTLFIYTNVNVLTVPLSHIITK
jgi:hypothetical protein